MTFRQWVCSSMSIIPARRKYSFAHTITSSDLPAFLRTYTPPIPPQTINSPSAVPSATIYTLPQETTSLRVLIPLLHEKFPNSIGCLASSFAGQPRGKDTISIAHFWNMDQTTYRIFRSAEKGKEPASVGRWRPLGETVGEIGEIGARREGNALERAVNGGDWSNVWEEWKKSSVGEQIDGQVVDLEGLELVNPNQIEMSFLFSTATSLSPTLDLLPSTSSKAGLVLPPTPFTTGRPYTIFFKNQTHEQGAVGLTIVSKNDPEGNKRDRAVMDVSWEGMEPVEMQAYEVVSAQGNLLLSISPCAKSNAHTIANPTKHLITLLQRSTSAGFDHKSYLGSKEKEFFLGLIRPRGYEGSLVGEGLGKMEDVKRVVRILSGDPARGGMAIEREDSLQVGERFLFIHRPDSGGQDQNQNQARNLNASMEEGSSMSRTFAFRTSSSCSLAAAAESSAADSDHMSIEGFDCSSEAGFIVCFPSKKDKGNDDESRGIERGFADKGIEGGRLIVRLDE